MANKTTTALAAAALIACASAAHALPTLASGDFTLNPVTNVMTDVTTTTMFALTSTSVTPTSPSHDMIAFGPLPTLTLTSPLNFTTGTPGGSASFNFANAALGNFTGTSVAFLGTFMVGQSTTVSYAVLGNFTLGTGWANAGQTLTASETWSLTQTGGPNHSISLSGTFNTPAATFTTPEPGTLALLGSALAGFGLFRRRRRGA